MSNGSLHPVLELNIPDLAGSAWVEVVRRAWKRSGEIADQRDRHSAIANLPHDDWQLLRRFEYRHFYNGWVAMAFRLRACAVHAQTFTDVFQKTGGTAQNEDLYLEDDALFDFFVKGLSALESFSYGLYALGALICTPPHAPSEPPSAQFSLLDPRQPGRLRAINPENTHGAFERFFPGELLTNLLGHMFSDEMYLQWRDTRNLLAHRVATAGRSNQYQGPGFDALPLSVTPWAGNLTLDAGTTTSRYEWLKDTINSGIESTATFVQQQLVYTEDQLPRLIRLRTLLSRKPKEGWKRQAHLSN